MHTFTSFHKVGVNAAEAAAFSQCLGSCSVALGLEAVAVFPTPGSSALGHPRWAMIIKPALFLGVGKKDWILVLACKTHFLGYNMEHIDPSLLGVNCFLQN